MEHLNALVSWFFFTALGLPDQEKDFVPSCGWSSSKRARHFARGLYDEVDAFSDSAVVRDRHFPMGGRADVHEAITKLEEFKYTSNMMMQKVDDVVSIALALSPC